MKGVEKYACLLREGKLSEPFFMRTGDLKTIRMNDVNLRAKM